MSTALGTAYGSYYGTSTSVAGALCLIPDPTTPEAGSLPLSVGFVGAAGESVGLAIDNAAWPAIATLSAALSTGGAITSLPVTATTVALAAGAMVMTAMSGSSQLWTVSSAVAAGVTSIPVSSQTPNAAYPSGSNVGPTTVLDTYGDGISTAVMPPLAAGTHTLSGLGSNSGTYDIQLPIKFNPLSTASDVNTPAAPTTTQQIKWRLYDPRVSVYTPGQMPRVNLATRPRCDSWGSGQDWAFVNTYFHGTYSLLTGQSVVLRKNLYSNPAFSGSVSPATFSVNGGGGAVSLSTPTTGGPIPGAQTYGRATFTTANGLTSNNGWNLAGSGPTVIAAQQGDVIAASLYMRVSRAGQTMALYIQFLDSTGANILNKQINFTPAANTWQYMNGVSAAAPANTASVRILGYQVAGSNWQVGDTVDISGVLVEKSLINDTFFDGDTSGLPGSTCAWTGTAEASISTAALSGLTTAIRKTVTTADSAGFTVLATTANPDNATTTAINSPVITPGATYTISLYARATSAAAMSGALTYAFYDASGAKIGSSTVISGSALISGSWVRQSFTMTAPANAAMLGAYFKATGGTPAINDTIDLTGLLIEQASALGTYFDGTTTATDTVYYWSGTPGDSPSVAVPGFYQFTYNPEKWTSPLPSKNLTHQATPPIGGQILAWEAGQKVTNFSFTGVLRSQAEYLALQAWAVKNSRFWLVDHRNVARLVMFTQFDHAPRNSPTTPWEADYTVSVTQYTANDGWN